MTPGGQLGGGLRVRVRLGVAGGPSDGGVRLGVRLRRVSESEMQLRRHGELHSGWQVERLVLVVH
jgi:hypothetical protein